MSEDKFEAFSKCLQEIADKYENDPEGCHKKMDRLLVKTLKDEGYDTSIFENAEKWYA